MWAANTTAEANVAISRTFGLFMLSSCFHVVARRIVCIDSYRGYWTPILRLDIQSTGARSMLRLQNLARCLTVEWNHRLLDGWARVISDGRWASEAPLRAAVSPSHRVLAESCFPKAKSR